MPCAGYNGVKEVLEKLYSFIFGLYFLRNSAANKNPSIDNAKVMF